MNEQKKILTFILHFKGLLLVFCFSFKKVHKGMGYIPSILPYRTSLQSLILLSFIALQASRVWVQNKVDESKHEIHSQVDAITAGTASVVNLTAGKFQ